MNLITQATVFAASAHDRQIRKGGGLPYILHPMEAAAIVATMTDDQILIAAALLHDILEDTPITYDELAVRFGSQIADIVQIETEDKSKSWAERKGHTIETLPGQPAHIKIVMLGDKLSNLRSTYNDYLRIGDRLWERFRMKDKNMQGWYYLGMLKGFQSIDHFPAYQEYLTLARRIFGEP